MGCWLAAGQGAGREEPSASAGTVAWAAHSRYQKTVTKGGFPELIKPSDTPRCPNISRMQCRFYAARRKSPPIAPSPRRCPKYHWPQCRFYAASEFGIHGDVKYSEPTLDILNRLTRQVLPLHSIGAL